MGFRVKSKKLAGTNYSEVYRKACAEFGFKPRQRFKSFYGEEKGIIMGVGPVKSFSPIDDEM